MSSKALERLRELDRREREAKAQQTPPNTPPPTAEGGKSQSIRTTTTANGRDDEIQSMLDSYDLLAEAQRITGESGHQSGDYVAFGSCPICGHRDCFRVYPQTHSWSCYGASNTTGISGGSVLDLWQATGRASDATEAVRMLREATNHPFQPKQHDRGEALSWDDEGEGAAPKLSLPRWQGVQAANPPKRRPCLIDGVLRRGHVGLFSGRAKVGKSWLGLMLCVAVACGVPWLGFEVARGNVLILDPEIDPRSLDQRLHKVCAAMGVDATEADAHITRWSLRGVRKSDGSAPTLDDVAHDLRELQRCDELPQLDLIFVDSMAALMTGDENASRDVRRNFNVLLEIAEITGAGIACSHHQGKTPSAEAADRARGSSAFTDCPDVVLSLDEVFPPSGKPSDFLQDKERALCLTCAGIREFAPPQDVGLIWRYPLHRLDVQGLTSSWKPKSSQSDGGKRTANLNKIKSELRASTCVSVLLSHMLAQGIGADGMAASDAASVVSEATGETVKPQTLKAYVAASDLVDVWQKSANRWRIVPRHLPREPATTPEQGQADI